MIKICTEFPDGKKSDYIYADGINYPSDTLDLIPKKDLKHHLSDVKNLHIRDDDIYLATFLKSGTHWVWEILVMLQRGNAEYETKTKEAAFLDFQHTEIVDTIPSPRVLNCHYPCKLTPKDVFRKKNKIIHVIRNPKDVFVSLYFHLKHYENEAVGMESFEAFLPKLIGQYGLHFYYPWFQYVKEWERFSKENPDDIINIYFEDLKEDTVREIKKLDKFLGTNRSDDLIRKIADACDFQKLKKADEEVKVQDKMSVTNNESNPIYRKGHVGDWKNHFTVAMNDKVDEWLTNNFVDTDLKIRYSL